MESALNRSSKGPIVHLEDSKGGSAMRGGALEAPGLCIRRAHGLLSDWLSANATTAVPCGP